MKLLFVVPARLGDAIMLTPALARLKEVQHGCQIDILAMSTLGASAFENNPNCNTIYIFEGVEKLPFPSDAYQLIVLAHSDRESRMLDVLKAINLPIVLIEEADPEQSQPLQSLRFIDRVFSRTGKNPDHIGYQIFPSQHDFDYASSLLGNHGKMIGIHLGCHGINKGTRFLSWGKKKQHQKLWPIQSYIAFARAFYERNPDYVFVITGGENERHLADEFSRGLDLPVINITGQTSTLQTAAIMKRFSVYLTPDTGTMHLACAMEVPLIALFGPTSVKRTGPYPNHHMHRVIATDGPLSCLAPEEVLRTVELMLAAN